MLVTRRWTRLAVLICLNLMFLATSAMPISAQAAVTVIPLAKKVFPTHPKQNQYKSAQFNATAGSGYTMTVINGTGEDLTLKNCKSLGLLKRLICNLENLVIKAKLKLRVDSGEIKINGVVVANSSQMKNTVKSFTVPVTLKATNKIEVKSKGFILSYVTVSISGSTQPPVNVPPVANFIHSVGPNRVVSFDASTSLDSDGSIASYSWNFGDNTTGSGILTTHTYASAGSFNASLTVTDNQGATAQKTVTVVIVPNAPPVADFTFAVNGFSVQFNGSASHDPDGSIASYSWDFGDSTTGAGAQATHTYAAFDDYIVTLTVVDSLGAQGQIQKSISIADVTPPVLTITKPGATLNSPFLEIAGTSNEALSEILVNGEVLALDATKTSFSGSKIITQSGLFQLNFEARDLRGNLTQLTQTVQVTLPQVPSTPDPIAPVISTNEIISFGDSYNFLFTGANPVQRNVAVNALVTTQMSGVRGRVLVDGTPLDLVKVSAVGHPEFGETSTRTGGVFDFMFNGGGSIVLRFERAGYLPIERRVEASWNDYVSLEDVWLTQIDAVSTRIALSDAAQQVAVASRVQDDSGSRQAVIVVPPSTQAQLKFADGSTQTVSSLNLRTTEYTVGVNGPDRMPAQLPPQTLYTYAVEISADEALAAGATSVDFNQPVYYYVENFLNFPVGTNVPTGYYNKSSSNWVSSSDGRIIEVLSVSAGSAVITTNEARTPAAAAELAALGISTAELQMIGSRYTQGQSLWRVPMTHFTAYDCNWSGPKRDKAKTVTPAKAPFTPSDIKSACEEGGCVINLGNQAVSESLPVAGTSYSLNYYSDRVEGRQAERTIHVPIIGPQINTLDLDKIIVRMQVLGRRFETQYNPAINLSHTFTWDGKDVFGRYVSGTHNAVVAISYQYDNSTYVPVPPTGTYSFGQPPSTVTGGPASRKPSIQTFEFNQSVTVPPLSSKEAIGGWSLNVHHKLDELGNNFYAGNDFVRENVSTKKIVRAMADSFTNIRDVQVAPSGRPYIAQSTNIVRLNNDGSRTVIAGGGATNFFNSSGPALSASLSIASFAVKSDNLFYISDTRGYIWKYENGQIYHQAGNPAGSDLFLIDAKTARFVTPGHIRLSPEGEIYFVDRGRRRIFKIDADNKLIHVAGTGLAGTTLEGAQAVTSNMDPRVIAIGEQGRIYVSTAISGQRSIIWTIDSAGALERLIGGGNNDPVDGSLGTDIQIEEITSLVLSDDERLFASSLSGVIGQADRRGILQIVANSEQEEGDTGDDGPAIEASFSAIGGIAFAGNGDLIVADRANDRLRKIEGFRPPGSTEKMVVSKNGSEVYIFNLQGRHLRTLDALTGDVLLYFDYNAQGHLIAVRDQFNNTTQIVRDGNSVPTQIVSPYGVITNVAVSNDELIRLTTPKGEIYRMSYLTGLLTSFENPKGGVNTFAYNGYGQLIADDNAAGGSMTLAMSLAQDKQVMSQTSAMGVKFEIISEVNDAGEKISTIVPASGGGFSDRYYKAGHQERNYSDGSTAGFEVAADPRFGMAGAYNRREVLLTQSGIQLDVGRTIIAPLSNPNDPFSYTNIVETISSNGRVTTSDFDKASRTRTVVSPKGRVLQSKLNANSQLDEIAMSGIAPTTFSYDSRGRLQATAQGPRATSMTYNSAGYLESVTNSLNQTKSYSYDVNGNVLRETLPDNRFVQYSYDENGNLASVTPFGKSPHMFSYSVINQLTNYLPPELSGTPTVTQYHYDADRRIASIDRPDGQSIVNAYHPTSGLLQIQSSATDNISMTYFDGKVSTMNTEDLVGSSFFYDGSMMIRDTYTGVLSGYYARNFNSNLEIGNDDVNGEIVSYFYDVDGLMTQAGQQTYAYSNVNTQLLSSTLGTVNDSFTYNTFGEMQTYSSANFSSSYTRDNLGRITNLGENQNGSIVNSSFIYDDAGRLVQVSRGGVVTNYDYDSNNNRLAKRVNGAVVESGAYDEQDRAVSYNGNAYTYNLNGELISKTKAGQSTAYEYDVYGNLKRAILPNTSIIDYLIDGRGRRAAKKLNGIITQRFIYQSQLQVAAELTGAGSVRARFVYGSKMNVPDHMIMGGVTYKIVSDHLGSVRIVQRADNRQIVQEMTYDEFGRVLSDTNPGFQPFGFAGGIYDRDTGLVLFGARSYDPETGRWISKDPIGFNGGDTNLYGYIVNDPINFIDPSGLSQEEVENAVLWLKDNRPDLFVGVGSVNILDGPVPGGLGIALPGNIIVDTGKHLNDSATLRQAQIVQSVAHELMHLQNGLINSILGIGKNHQLIEDEEDKIGLQYLDSLNKSKKRLKCP